LELFPFSLGFNGPFLRFSHHSMAFPIVSNRCYFAFSLFLDSAEVI
jgi:hypothetical protein